MGRRHRGRRDDEVTVVDLLLAFAQERDGPKVQPDWPGHLYLVPPLPPDRPRRWRWLRAADDDPDIIA
ncbi:MAG TPA: hypothetical protein VGM75_29060 [Pseudonocardiaceae bacterium]|jgi:hypothetical protein